MNYPFFTFKLSSPSGASCQCTGYSVMYVQDSHKPKRTEA
uniref:Uncharacterized protein n=1 Tax=Anguilla anguilla TaxID=7936 RepID=A0A0E9R0B4_ANGAN